MEILIKKFEKANICSVNEIWNEIVEVGEAFPQLEILDEETGTEFFESQSFTGVAFDVKTGETVGLYILHPNNIGRCGHICNASYAVKKDFRGRNIGEALVKDCLVKAKELGFKILQFNAVVEDNFPALKLYENLGFIKLGTIPNGFNSKSGEYKNIIPHFKEL